MSWDCPHNNNGHCRKRDKDCEQLSIGCVLKNKTKFIDSANYPERKKATQHNSDDK